MSPRPSQENKIITVASGKGGVGKTWFSISLGHILARQGRRVLLFDGDLGLANVDIQLGLTPTADLGDVLTGSMEMSQAILNFEDNGVQGGRLDILPGRSGSGSLASLARGRLEKIRLGLLGLTSSYDYVIQDLAAGVDAGVTALTCHKGPILVVMTADPTSLTDAYAFIKLVQMQYPRADFRIVVNMVSDTHEGESVFEAIKRACERFLRVTPILAGIIHADKAVTNAIRAQTPLLTAAPQSNALEDIRHIARAFPAHIRALTG